MLDLLDNEISIGDKIVFSKANTNKKDLDYGIVENLSKSGKSCRCKSLTQDNNSVIRKGNQIVKVN
jgi:hypothetical protein